MKNFVAFIIAGASAYSFSFAVDLLQVIGIQKTVIQAARKDKNK
jgi:hypothetical protein